MGLLNTLEKKLDEVLVKKSPVQLPENAKKTIVQYLPIINLVLGVLTLWATFALWRWARVADRAVDLVNDLSAIYGGNVAAPVSRLTFMVWVSLAVLAVQSLLYVAAYPGLKARSKSGWNLLFYAALVNGLHTILSLFTDYNAGGGFIGGLVGTVVGLYLLFQVRSQYGKAKEEAKSKIV